jgi:hypothetical protein
VLLGTVVHVALQPAPLGVLGRDDPFLGKDLGVHEETLRLRARQAAIDGGRRDGLGTAERAERAALRQPRRENRILKEGPGILKDKNAAAVSARERATR